MAKVVGLGYAIDNDEPNDSGKYRIQIPGNPSPSSPPINKTHTQQQTQAGLSIVHNYQQENRTSSQGAGLDRWTKPSPEVSPPSNQADIYQPHDDDLEWWTKTGTNSSPPSETTVNGHYRDSDTKTGTKPSPHVNNIPSNDCSDRWTKWTRNPNENKFKIGDRAKLGDEIFTIDTIVKDYLGGYANDGSYIGGHADTVQFVSVDESPVTLPTNVKIDRVSLGNGMVEIVRQPEATIAAGGIEYEC